MSDKKWNIAATTIDQDQTGLDSVEDLSAGLEPILERPKRKRSVFRFFPEMVREYPGAEQRVSVFFEGYMIDGAAEANRAKTKLLSPHGIEIVTTKELHKDQVLRLAIRIPDYWHLKSQVVDYQCIETPNDLEALGKVVEIHRHSIRGRKKDVLIQIVNIEPADEEVIQNYILKKTDEA